MSNPVVQFEADMAHMRSLIARAEQVRGEEDTEAFDTAYNEIVAKADLFQAVAASVYRGLAARRAREAEEVHTQIPNAVEDDALLALFETKAERLEKQATRLDADATYYAEQADRAERNSSNIDDSRYWLTPLDIHWVSKGLAEVGPHA